MVVSHSFNPWFYDIMKFSFKAYWWKSRWNRWCSLYNIMGTIIWLMLFMNSNNQYSNKTHTFLFRSHSSNAPTSKTSFTGFHSLFRESLLTKAFSSISLYPWKVMSILYIVNLILHILEGKGSFLEVSLLTELTYLFVTKCYIPLSFSIRSSACRHFLWNRINSRDLKRLRAEGNRIHGNFYSWITFD